VAASRSRYAALVMLAVLGWLLVGASSTYLSWPMSDRFGRSCGSALAPVDEPLQSDDSYLGVCTNLTTPRADIGWSLASASILLAVAATGAAVASHGRRPWPPHRPHETVPPTAVN
jgi:hypothetical protein